MDSITAGLAVKMFSVLFQAKSTVSYSSYKIIIAVENDLTLHQQL